MGGAVTDPVGFGEILTFWFEETDSKKWFKKSAAFDASVVARFGATHAAAVAGALDRWAEDPKGALALIIVLDQFSRNIHRGSPLAFAADARALEVARQVVAAGWDAQMSDDERQFVYMPFMHSEELAAQETCVELFGRIGRLKWAVDHHKIIARFGRFPHRNAVLKRASTEEEAAFLDEPGSSF